MSQIMDFLVQTSCVSSDLLKEIMRDYLSGKNKNPVLRVSTSLQKQVFLKV